MRRSRTTRLFLAGILMLAMAAPLAAHAAAGGYYEDDGYDDAYRYERRETTVRRESVDEPYAFSTTRMVNDWDAPAAVKVPVLPVAFVVDVVFLPAELIADAVR